MTMKMRALIGVGWGFAAMTMCAAPAAAAPAIGPEAAPACTAGQPTAASYTWNFTGEAATILKGIQSDARQASDYADTLDSYSRGYAMDWRYHAQLLRQMSSAVNDMGVKLCRLEEIRRVVTPEQRKAIDVAAGEARLMAAHAQDAYNFCTSHYEELWSATYRSDVNNLYNEASALAHDLGAGERASS